MRAPMRKYTGCSILNKDLATFPVIPEVTEKCLFCDLFQEIVHIYH